MSVISYSIGVWVMASVISYSIGLYGVAIAQRPFVMGFAKFPEGSILGRGRDGNLFDLQRIQATTPFRLP